jgi:hypothetical protein
MMRFGDLAWTGLATALGASAIGAVLWPVSVVAPPSAPSVASADSPERPEAWAEAVSTLLQPRPSAPAAAPRASQPLSDHVLIGVVESDAGGWALVSRGGDLTSIPLGASLDGYELVEVTAETAAFERDGDRLVLTRQ